MNCKYCRANCIRKGIRDGSQNYQCKICKRYQKSKYRYQKYSSSDEMVIKRLNNRGMGIRMIASFLCMPKSSVLDIIRRVGQKIRVPVVNENAQEYEIDEMQTYIGKNIPENYRYIIYAINRATRRVVDFIIGKRNTESIKKIVDVVLKLNPRRIFTDKLNIYPILIPGEIHRTGTHLINHIERMNLTLRTHLKRLSRKTICFSRSEQMLENSLKIYWWGGL